MQRGRIFFHGIALKDGNFCSIRGEQTVERGSRTRLKEKFEESMGN